MASLCCADCLHFCHCLRGESMLRSTLSSIPGHNTACHAISPHAALIIAHSPPASQTPKVSI